MHRLIASASFIHANMPFGTHYDAPVLSVEDAWDVAAYINSQPRPDRANLDRDYPNRARKPVDAPFPPFADKFPLEQHKYGPFKPILDAQRSVAAAPNVIWSETLLAVLSGGAVGFSLGLIGGGGSILAVPLLLYVVGIEDPHRRHRHQRARRRGSARSPICSVTGARAR